ncbi:oxidoreductase [Longispora fulva]|uniref:NAD(P)-dependent dehydrogenase (Short-subunit alcohol dehydrogenase family) n=1 Tax=Longispora fulva TaxID=619741 RepID=A0A8J7GJ62_9ACTN|nr:SDR family oxidoreductase [Longispora fulva]MBG6138505.1 NAD(P)-dependent dehydrogenase (short-subunit alcohol dehydrogenase family) [Longispora fulva]GIG62389.1 oxidoreductase [Longispora fulva]
MRRFDGRVAFVTGAAHGIGRAIAIRLAAEGAAVVVADLDGEAAGALARTLAEHGGGALATHCDVRDREAVRSAVAAAATRFGRLDVLVNNVGVAGEWDFEKAGDDEWAQQSDPTLGGAVRCVQEALPHLLRAPGGGSVVSIGSVNGLAAFGGEAYSAAKAGLVSLTQNLALRYGRRGRELLGTGPGWVRFNLVAPGTVRTRVWEGRPEELESFAKQYPLGRVGEPEDIAAAVAFLASADAAWITGVVLPVDGGITAGHPAFFYDLR